jgi:ribosome-associated heat shock protein Hsp15
MSNTQAQELQRLRVDKWLWAARFFKTRSLAKTAIEGGKVQLDGQRVKVSKEISVGDCLLIRQGWDEKEVVVEQLGDRRGGAPAAQTLYRETERSLAKRQREIDARKAAGSLARPAQRPDKHDRRRLTRLRRHLED